LQGDRTFAASAAALAVWRKARGACAGLPAPSAGRTARDCSSRILILCLRCLPTFHYTLRKTHRLLLKNFNLQARIFAACHSSEQRGMLLWRRAGCVLRGAEDGAAVRMTVLLHGTGRGEGRAGACLRTQADLLPGSRKRYRQQNMRVGGQTWQQRGAHACKRRCGSAAARDRHLACLEQPVPPPVANVRPLRGRGGFSPSGMPSRRICQLTWRGHLRKYHGLWDARGRSGREARLDGSERRGYRACVHHLKPHPLLFYEQ